ncbi:MAG: methyl-accepting chemotaxis protein [Bacteroidales bacterium]|nr:methyl-accepting chemotaxis protein [Bacteroidales bacterium]
MKIKLTISRRLILGFGTITLLVLIALTSIFFTLNRSAKIANNNLNLISPSTEGINELNVLINETKMLIKNWIFVEKHSDTQDKLKLKSIHEKEYPELIEQLATLSKHWSNAEKELFDEIIKSINDTLFPLHKSVMSSLSSFESYDDLLLLFDIYPLVEAEGNITSSTQNIQEKISSLHVLIAGKQDSGNNRLIRSFSVFRVFLVIVSIALILIAVFSSLVTTRNIITPINQLKSSLLRKSKGYFSEEFVEPREDEIGEMTTALEEMSGSIRTIVEDIQTGAGILATSSKSINDSARAIADGANMQASSAEEVSASMEEMTSITNQNTENAQHAEKIAKQVANNVEEIRSSVANTAKAMKNITEKISIINDIAERIDLLAINAAIEAARAGEHGKGFAVVASEVRNLAESSQVAANEIDEASKKSVEIAEKSNVLLEGIIPHINETLNRVQEISSASIEQSLGINQVNIAIQQLTSIIQNNSASAEELSASSDELLHQSDNLLKGITFFKINENEEVESTEELEKQIEKLKELLIKRKHDYKKYEITDIEKETDKRKNETNKPKTIEEKVLEKNKGIKINMKEKDDDEFEKY